MLYKIVNGAVSFENKTILEEINFEVKNQERIGIVGRNGCGKTTLLRAIVGDVELESGLSEEEFSVIKLGEPVIGYLRQDAIMDESITLLDEILKAYQDILEVEKKIKIIEKKLENCYEEKLVNQYQDLHQLYQVLGGYSYQKEYEMALLKNGFQERDKFKKLSDFSYGQRTKIAFLRMILSKPDLLLLDEPTNHLDVSAIEWLEDYLKTYPKAIVMVSHDRMFLDTVCNVTYAISYGSMKRYSGNYSFYERQRQLDYERNKGNFERQQKEIERLRKIVERFRYKPSKASMAMSKLKQIERMVKVEKPNRLDERTFGGTFVPRIESYREVLKVKNLGFGYEKEKMFGEVSFSLERGERLAIIGDNGTGKSTFLKTLLGILEPLAGKYLFGRNVEIGYFDQNVESLCGSDTVLENMRKEFPSIRDEDLRTSLGAFGFTKEMVFQQIDSLSGGQKVKLLLCKIMKNQPNVLILDEPTNHLDIVGRETIEQILSSYSGTIIFVSHDRYLVKKLADCLLVFENDMVSFYHEGYDAYLEKRKEKETGTCYHSCESNLNVREQKKYVSKFKERSKLERKLKKIEDEVEKLEQKINDYHRELMKEEVYMDVVKSKEIQLELMDTEQCLNQKMKEWEEIQVLLEE